MNMAKMLVGGVVCAAVALCAAGAWAENDCWARVRFQKTNGGKALQLSEFALYNWQGERVNSPLTVVADGTAATDLAVGQASGYVAGGLSGNPFSNSSEGLVNLFDKSTGTKLFRTANVTLNPATESTWIVITMRLAANTKPVAYNLATANDSVVSRSPTGWIVECSTNGVDWTIADTRADIAWPTTTYTWWNGGVSYPLAFDWDAFRASYAESVVYYASSNTHKPVPTVVDVADPTVTLTEGVDYTVGYEDWDRLGTATATVTGIGAYIGSEVKYHYEVLPAFEASLSSTVTTNDLVHPYYPVVTVRSVASQAVLTEGVHYRLEYNDTTGFGQMTVTVIGIGDFLGNEASLNFTVMTDLLPIPAQYSIVSSSLASLEKGSYRSETVKLHNNQYNDFFDAGQGTTYAALLDFGTARNIKVIGVAPRTGNAELIGRSRTFRIKGSNDLVNWTLLHTNVVGLTEGKINLFKLNAVESGASVRYIVLDNVTQLNVAEVWGYAKDLMVEATADPDPFASTAVESADAAAGVLVKGKLTSSPDGAAAVTVFVADQDYGDSYAQWSANGRRFDIGELTEGQTFQTRLAGLGKGLWQWRIFASRGGTHSASQVLPLFTVGSQVILPKAYLKNTALSRFYDGNAGNNPETTSDVWIVFDLEGVNFARNRPVGWRMWPRSGYPERIVGSYVDYGYDPAEGSVNWDVTSWNTNGQKRVYGVVSGVPENIVWTNDVTDIVKTTLEISPTRFFVPYVWSQRTKPPRYIRFRGITNANCSEIELRTTRYSTGTVIYLH
ncbi:MAG: hypothetical protein IKC15_07220 [Kiritimatiellae bacterium]|nr:hypothetical protein [Kiritimatiellia bacterium]